MGSVKDLVESEKLACRPGTDQSLRLIGLSHYLPGDASWKDSLGRPWSIEHMVKQEVDQAGNGEFTAAPNGSWR